MSNRNRGLGAVLRKLSKSQQITEYTKIVFEYR